MNVPNLAYDFPVADPASDPAGMPARVAIYADRERVRGQIAADLDGAGFRAIDNGALAALTDGPVALLGDVVVVDCPRATAEVMAGLAQLDMRVARSGARLVVSTTLDALNAVFAVLDQSQPQILVAPSRAERVVAVARALGEAVPARLREMSEAERLSLLRLSQQVDAIARSLDNMAEADDEWEQEGDCSQSGLRDARPDFRMSDQSALPAFGSPAPSSPSLPDPRMIRQIISNRQGRARFFDANLFADPAWDMLLDLAAAHGEGQKVSVSSLCIAAGVPATTALRWLMQMVETGVFCRVADPADRRRVFIELSESALAAMAGYFASIKQPAAFAA